METINERKTRETREKAEAVQKQINKERNARLTQEAIDAQNALNAKKNAPKTPEEEAPDTAPDTAPVAPKPAPPQSTYDTIKNRKRVIDDATN